MRPLPHFPASIPEEPLVLRLIFLLPDRREDKLVPIKRKMETMEDTDAFLREELERAKAQGVRIETEDGGIVRHYLRPR